ncbi:hypothetical protein [Burkholderia gladioli]|uniref:hypothetical protein n=1 Tax=Burkholderia gladioli TaxID=28095 RepID=UPI0016405011|nr:hypothetical protein [Burkholderia gladioli]
MKLLKLHYLFCRATARAAAPVMRITCFRFSKASRDNRLINALIDRVAANLLADGIEPGHLVF